MKKTAFLLFIISFSINSSAQKKQVNNSTTSEDSILFSKVNTGLLGLFAEDEAELLQVITDKKILFILAAQAVGYGKQMMVAATGKI